MKFEKPVLEVVLSETTVVSKQYDGTVNFGPESGSGWTGSCCYKARGVMLANEDGDNGGATVPTFPQ